MEDRPIAVVTRCGSVAVTHLPQLQLGAVGPPHPSVAMRAGVTGLNYPRQHHDVDGNESLGMGVGGVYRGANALVATPLGVEPLDTRKKLVRSGPS